MAVETSGHSRGNPRLYELIEHAPKTGKSPTIWAWPEIIDYSRSPASRCRDRGLPIRSRGRIQPPNPSRSPCPTRSRPHDKPEPQDELEPQA